MTPSVDTDFVHRFVPSEMGDAASAPTLLLLHGTGGNENQMLGLGRELAGPGYHLLSPRGKILEGGGTPRFFRRLAEGVFDEADLIRRAHELVGFVPSAAERYGFDAGRVIALGYSNGANIAAAVLLLCPGALAGAALLRPMVPLTPATLPDLAGIPVLACSGQNDPIVPVANAARLVSLLEQSNARVQTSWHMGGHELADADFQATREWLAHLGQRPERPGG